MTAICETGRLRVRHLTLDDAPFILELLNEPSFLRFIGDRQVRDLAGARGYLEHGPLASYRRFGFGLFLVEDLATGAPAGMCGLLKRDALEDVDLGFAFVPRWWGRGYALESARAVLDWARAQHHLGRVVAITNLDNEASIRLLEKLGFGFERLVRLPGEAADVRLFGRPRRAG